MCVVFEVDEAEEAKTNLQVQMEKEKKRQIK